MLICQFVEGVTLKPRFMVSASLRAAAATVIMSKLRRESRAPAAANRYRAANRTSS
jgi:hypothetical protein